MKKIIPDLKGIDYIERVSATKFNIKPTFLGRTLMSKGAYLEIRPNSSIQGIGSNNKPFMTKGVYIKAVGLSKIAYIKVDNYKTQSFLIVRNRGMFKVGNKVIAFGL